MSCPHAYNRSRVTGIANDALARREVRQRSHRTPEKRAEKGKRWPYQAAYNTAVRVEMIKRGIFDAADSFDLGT